MAINWENVRVDFPILKRQINDRPLIYLDNAATSQKPQQVIDALTDFYANYNANVYRSVHTLSGEATEAFENVRQKAAEFIGAKRKEEIIFTRGTTTALNYLAKGLAHQIEPGDEILLTYMEHHSNIIPWQQLAKDRQAKVVYVQLTKDGRIDLEDYQKKLNPKTKIVSFTHISNVLGTINPVKEMTDQAHRNHSLVIVDGAQAVPHIKVDVSDLNVDFYAFSGHKMLGPTGIGVLYGKLEHLNVLEPAEFGGEMIDFVEEEASTWAAIPNKFEAGTPNIAGAIGLGAAIDYINQLGMTNIEKYEQSLLQYLFEKLKELPELEIYGPKNMTERIGVISFNLEDIHPHDLSTALDLEGVAIRAGHHCGQLLIRQLNVPATCRMSLSFYNTKEEIDQMIQVLKNAKEFFDE